MEDAALSYVLKVRRPRLTRPPEPPQEISAWLEDGWDDPSNTVAVEETVDEFENNREQRIVKFADDPPRTAALERWKLQTPASRLQVSVASTH
jgi:hypothetical protein